MSQQKIPRFVSGQVLGATALNKVVDTTNRLTSQRYGASGAGDLPSRGVLDLQIKALNPATLMGDQNLTCVIPGMIADPSAQEWTVLLPFIYWETSRPPVTFTYVDINTRTAVDGSNPQETHFLTPPITVGEFAKVILREDGVFQMLGDGRMWGADPP